MFKKVIFLTGAIFLILSLSLLMASEELRLASTTQKENVQGDVQKIQKVGEVRTLTIKQPLKLRTTREGISLSGTSIQRDFNAGRVTTPSENQLQPDELIFQKPAQERKSNTGQME